MASGEIDITPGYVFEDAQDPVTHAKLNQLGNPTVRLKEGSVTERELAIDLPALAASLSVNKIINGNFDVWQRGTGSTNCTVNTRTLLADRWSVRPAGSNMTQQRSTEVPNGNSRYSLQLNGAAGVTTVEVAQRIEAHEVLTGVLTNVVLSGKLWNDTGTAFAPTLIVRTPTAEDDWTSSSDQLTEVLQECSSGEWTSISHTFDASALTNVENGLEIVIQIPSGSLVSGDTVRLSQLDLRAGDTAGAFQLVPYQLTEAQCLRYYERVPFGDTSELTAMQAPLGIGACDVGDLGGSVVAVSLPCARKRKVPTVSFASQANLRLANNSAKQSVSGVTTSGTSRDRVQLQLTGITGYGPILVYSNGTVNALIIDAEL